jgi:hypothetical protein
MCSEGKVANGLDLPKNENGKFYSDLIGWMYPSLRNVRSFPNEQYDRDSPKSKEYKC